MSIIDCNNALDKTPNMSRFHELLNLPWTARHMVQCGSCGFSSCLTRKIRDIATQLGILSPQYEAIITDAKVGAIAGDDHILISQGYAAAFENNSTSPFTAEEVEGTLAHEIGHLALNHSNSVLSDPCYDAVDSGLIKASSDTFKICVATANSLMEKQADLFTLRKPSFAKKLIQMMKKWLLLDGFSSPASSFDHHPRTEVRIDYLTQGYCDAVQHNDRDLCNIPVLAHMRMRGKVP